MYVRCNAIQGLALLVMHWLPLSFVRVGKQAIHRDARSLRVPNVVVRFVAGHCNVGDTIVRRYAMMARVERAMLY